ncbi:MAG TPA: outer membrane beta-barrel protein [Flavitalea sp.]|nr:outer membrane beta-barrel protein [Flavitalea sp.]
MKSMLAALLLFCSGAFAQNQIHQLKGSVSDSLGQSVPGATISILRFADSSMIASVSSDREGNFMLEYSQEPPLVLRITHSGFQPNVIYISSNDAFIDAGQVRLVPKSAVLNSVTVIGKKPAVEFRADKTVVNVEASLSNIGATVLEVLEKSPGISTDKDGNLSLNGKPNVMVMIDNKPTYLAAADLVNMLSGINASQVESIELIRNPSSRYDAAGTSGIINIRLKKNKIRGFNGSVSAAFGQGVYPKNNNTLQLNYRSGKMNLFLNYSLGINEGFGELYALRKYYEPDEKTVTAMLEQPSMFKFSNTSHPIKTGIDYSFTKNTSAALTFTGQHSDRLSENHSTATWMDAEGKVDSTISTSSDNTGFFKNAGINLNLRHAMQKDAELTADVDFVNYKIGNSQSFQNQLSGGSGYTEYITGDLPSTLKIFSAKADYNRRMLNGGKFEAGFKTSFIKTDNFASYFILEDDEWKPDYNKTNHFIYNEHINAVYANMSKEIQKWTLQGGIRYEHTLYDATQQDNPTRKDSSFSNNYSSLFPTATVNFKADSVHSFSFSAGRRIDRPPFQKLNPFIFIINKYTYQQGNPYILPQYSWNFDFSHNYKDIFVTTISYSETKNYFSQVFHSDPNTGLIIYSEGNLGRMRNIGLAVSSAFNIADWWSVSLQASVNDKKIEGFVWDERRVSLATFYLNGNNQFKFGKGWTGELSGFFHTSEQELQEITDPTGQLAVGIGKQVMKNKATIKLTGRDIFYTQAMKGNTLFKQASEYFKFTRDSRVVTIAFTYRFGKTFQTRITSGSATDEMNRAAGAN